MPITVNKKFKGDYNQNANNEVASFNRIFVDFSGGPIMMLVGFCILIVSGAIIFMIIHFGTIMVILVVGGVSVIGTIGIISSVIALVAWAIRTITGTKAQVKMDKYSEEWSQLVYPVGAHIVVNDPYKREIEVHNGRDISETRSYAIDTMPPEPKGSNMPSLYDLGKGNGKEEV